MKKLTALLFVIVLSVSMVACGSNKDSDSLSKQDIEVTGIEFTAPEGFSKQGNASGMEVWYGPDYPNDLSNIVIGEGEKDSKFSDYGEDALKEQLAGEVEQQYIDQGMAVENMEVKVCEYIKISGFDAVKVHLTYTLSGTHVEQLEYMIDADKTYVYSFTNAPNADWMDEFTKAAESIKVNYK